MINAVLCDTLRLAGMLGVPRVVAMSGCPGTPGGSSTPHWSAGAWLPDYDKIFEWQWSERILPYWHDIAACAKAQGMERVCLELHPGMAVYSTYTLLRLRDAVGPIIAANLDPNHLFWQGLDPLAVIAALGEAIGYVHTKDTIIDLNNRALNGILDSRWLGRPSDMPWYFCTLGYGHDAGFWKAFVLKLLADSYDGVLSIEHEDPLLAPLDGVRKSVAFLSSTASLMGDPPLATVGTTRPVAVSSMLTMPASGSVTKARCVRPSTVTNGGTNDHTGGRPHAFLL